MTDFIPPNSPAGAGKQPPTTSGNTFLAAMGALFIVLLAVGGAVGGWLYLISLIVS